MSFEHAVEMFVAFIAWVAIAEFRILKVKSKLVTAAEKNKDAAIQNKIHNLTDAELDALLTKDLERSKPST